MAFYTSVIEEVNALKHVLAFLCVISGETWPELMDLHPDYIKEKFIRYIQEPAQNGWEWGLHPSLRRYVFDKYCEKWRIPNDT